MGHFLRMEKRQQIQALASLGWSNRAISTQVGVDRETVAHYRRLQQNPPIVPADETASIGQNPQEVPAEFSGNQAEEEASALVVVGTNSIQLRPHTQHIQKAVLGRLSAQRIYQDLVEAHGYRGSYDSVKRYVRKLRKRSRRYRERLVHQPGREAQVDFGRATCRVRVNGKLRRPWLFKMTLSCSKHAYEELVAKQDLETFIRCHEHAFEFFGGIPEIVTLDNLKSGVLQASVYDPVANQVYLAFATHCGFAVNPCMPRTPEHKGVVERDIGYTKHNALDGRVFESFGEGNELLRHWNRRWARTRIHGTTKCQVWKMFREVEQPALHPCPEQSFVFFRCGVRKVDVNGLVEVDSRYYGVRHSLVGEQVIVRFNQQYVDILDQAYNLLIRHQTLAGAGKVSMPASVLPPWKHPNLESQELFYCRKARQVGPAFHAIVHKTLSTNHPLAIRRVRGFLSLCRSFARSIVETAAAELAHYQEPRVETLRLLCQRIAQGAPLPSSAPTLTQHHELIRPLTEYENAVMERTQS